MRVAVLYDRLAADAPADEVDNLRQAEAVSDALHALGHEARMVACGLDLVETARTLLVLEPDAVFNLVEALDGCDNLCGAVPGLLVRLGLPHTGGSAFALTATADKLVVKRLLRRAGLPTPDWFAPADLTGPGPEPRGPFLLKPRLEHGSVGLDEEDVLAAPDRAALAAALAAKEAAAKGPCLAEAFVDGREFNIGVLDGPSGPEVLPLAEIVFSGYAAGKPRVVGWRAKWAEGSFEYGHTERSFEFPGTDAGLLARLRGLTLACAGLLDLTGYARVDFRVDAHGNPLIIDVNPNPCIAPDAGFPAAAARAGLSYTDLVARILAAGLAAGPRRKV